MREPPVEPGPVKDLLLSAQQLRKNIEKSTDKKNVSTFRQKLLCFPPAGGRDTSPGEDEILERVKRLVGFDQDKTLENWKLSGCGWTGPKMPAGVAEIQVTLCRELPAAEILLAIREILLRRSQAAQSCVRRFFRSEDAARLYLDLEAILQGRQTPWTPRHAQPHSLG